MPEFDLSSLGDDLEGYNDSAPDGSIGAGSSPSGLSLNGIGSAVSVLGGIAHDLGIGQQGNEIDTAAAPVAAAAAPIDSRTLLIIGGIIIALVLLH